MLLVMLFMLEEALFILCNFSRSLGTYANITPQIAHYPLLFP